MDTEIQIEEQVACRNWEALEDWSREDYADYIDFIADCVRSAA